MSSPFFEAYFIRHGETEWNQQGRVQGQTDIPLNDQGIAQAIELSKLLADIPFSAVFSSDLSRARRTAELVVSARQLKIIEAVELRERSAGALEGQHTSVFDQWVSPFFLSEKAHSQKDYLQTSWHPEIESLASVYERVMNFLTPLTPEYDQETILVSTHGGVLRALLDHLDFIPFNRWTISNCGFIKLRIGIDGVHLLERHQITQYDILSKNRDH